MASTSVTAHCLSAWVRGSASPWRPPLDKYAEKSAADLELLSTIVCADREASQARRRMAFEELGRKANEVKPRFSKATILRNINELARDGLQVASSAHE
jgi:hypothetical protein